ncbi:hypothetical protein SASPL_115584 [Salvia splendens]|uniref:Protein kinase domain-containing protein n=1 Tax=Salvia splendens TaxID=180675 RepID=A0A8X9A1S0_SALSN|nr:hypothetical protein SASPL_115584 [Salvia splendens]
MGGNIISGSKSAKAKPLHWTSCLKIAEDAAQGLCYIHQAWCLVHGNLKSSNVLLGSDFEACLTDYCLVPVASSTPEEDLLSGRHQSKHPNLGPDAMMSWLRSVRDEEGEENRLEVALACSTPSPEQRPMMWQVVKLIQELEEVILMEDSEFKPTV